jgi:mannose-6-phosphate isomerase-like protein (cupin superfamily)
MSSNFRFISFNEDTSAILKELDDNPKDWQEVSSFENIGGLKDPYGFLPLIMAVVEQEGDNPKNTEILKPTPMFERHPAAINWLKSKGFTSIARCAFFKLKIGGKVGKHIDDGTYYLTKDRYHFSLRGRYMYECGDEQHIIEPGTFFWFDNKKYHQAINVGDEDRLTFVFDVPHSPNNP